MPEKGKKSLPVDIDTHRRIRIMAANEGVTMQDLVSSAISEHARLKTQPRDGQFIQLGQGTTTPVIGSQLSEAILKLEDVRNILSGIHHDLQKGTTVPDTSALGDIPRAVTGIPGAQGEHSKVASDLGPGAEEPGAWRKLPKPKGPTRTGPS